MTCRLRRGRWVETAFVVGLGAACWPPLAGGVELRPVLEARARLETFDTPLPRADQDPTYALGLLRARAGAEASWGERLKLRALLQGAAMSTLPDRAGFGSGPTYLATNGGDRSPQQIGLAELALTWRWGGGSLVVGRQPFADGNEPVPGVALLDWVARRRLAERLIGNFEFSNVGRRFDGARVTGDAGRAGRFEAFALRPLAGGFNYEDAFDQLDVTVAGASLVSPPGGWLPSTQVKLFAIGYDDEREVARAAAGDELEILTLGASAVAGTDTWDVLGWVALQRGDYGTRELEAWAVIVEVGRRFAGVRGAPSLHLVLEQASGGGDATERNAFFNLLPTNHKFYGSLDYFAFSNLRDLCLEARWNPAQGWTLGSALHDFSLVDRGDAWYGGSGAYSERELGYVTRRPAAGRFRADDLGRELDLTVTRALPHGFEARVEAGWFWGGAAAREFLAGGEDGGWATLELTWKR